jgi:hypothetical protein
MIKTQLIFLDAPFADASMSHRGDNERAISLEYFAPMRLVRELHAGYFRCDLFPGKLPKRRLSSGRRSN